LTIGDLHVERSLQTLTPAQHRYAVYLSLASWAAFPILMSQISREALGIHAFLSEFIRTFPRDQLEAAQPGTPLHYAIEYAAVFYGNCANYLGFGDTKFVPRVMKDDLVALVSPYPDIAAKLSPVVNAMYSLAPEELNLGYPPENTTCYYHPSDFTQSEQEGIDALMSAAKISFENTIVYRHADRYEVKTASIAVDPVGTPIGEFNGLPVFVTKGHFTDVLQKVNYWLRLARDCALNATEAEALTALIQHYETGNIADHIRYSEIWVRDSDPIIEHYHGFIESYRDPSGLRAEFESFVAAVDPVESRFLHGYVALANKVLPLLPNPPCYEREVFVVPSYNAINILTFCSSVTPIGINIPNYDEIRLTKGFKNVSLTNVLLASPLTVAQFPFMLDSQIPAFFENSARIKMFQVASHELYGHGSGKLFYRKDVEGKNVPDLLDPERVVTTYYGDGETYQTVFGGFGASYEECRAEATALYLSFKEEVLEFYQVPPEKRREFRLCSALDMLHKALAQLINYNPEARQWRQAHARARFAILRSLIIWGRGSVAVRAIDGRYKVIVDPDRLDAAEFAVANLLKHLNYYKAVRLPDQAQEFYGAITSLDDFWIDVRKQATELSTNRMIGCGGIVRKVGEGYELQRVREQPPSALDVAVSIVETVALALE
jgi:dipeptidyl-peptidase-3